jgi:hypothetical protein
MKLFGYNTYISVDSKDGYEYTKIVQIRRSIRRSCHGGMEEGRGPVAGDPWLVEIGRRYATPGVYVEECASY